MIRKRVDTYLKSIGQPDGGPTWFCCILFWSLLTAFFIAGCVLPLHSERQRQRQRQKQAFGERDIKTDTNILGDRKTETETETETESQTDSYKREKPSQEM